MACADPFPAFRVATEYLGNDIYTRASFSGLFLNLIPRGIFAPNTGITHSKFTIANQEPTDPDRAGTPITLTSTSTGAGACAYDFTSVSWGETEVTYSPVKLQWRGPLVCKDNAYFQFKPDEFLNKYVESITKYVQQDLENHLLYYYMRRVPIYVCRTAFDTVVAANSTLTAPVATSELTQQMLDSLAVQLIQNRATNPDSQGWVTMGPDGPLFSLAIHPQASQLIVQNNSEFRDDLRWAQSGAGLMSELMKRLGASRVIKNFRHIPWLTPPRFTHDGTKYVRVPTFASTTVTLGSGTNFNPAWVSPAGAPYEAAVVLSPNVMTSELINPKSSVGPVSFPSTNYMGDWQWVTGPQAVASNSTADCYDPLNKYGRHFAEFMHALAPGALPEAGALILYKRCAASYDLVQCT